MKAHRFPDYSLTYYHCPLQKLVPFFFTVSLLYNEEKVKQTSTILQGTARMV